MKYLTQKNVFLFILCYAIVLIVGKLIIQMYDWLLILDILGAAIAFKLSR